ncbi:unnamed protein product [Rotaria sp. Silwood2]|nr:unnamed protein product [Rotaria sp. Silwood2]CAF4472209.1 unnamed protein product [Rotaria sp. Silwood2]
MSTENSQPGHIPSERSNTLSASQSNIDQLLAVGIVTTSQPSSIQFNSTNMISNIQEHDHGTGTQHVGREQRHQQTQARRQPQQQEERQRLRQQQQQEQRERQRLRQQQQQEQRERQRQRQERNQRRYERWQERVAQRQQERYRREREQYEHFAYL